MLRKRYYILFVARDEDGCVRKISLPVQYVYGFVAAALVGAFTIVGLAGSYTRMLLKTESFNQVRQERESLRKNYQQMAQVAHQRDIQVASLGALASEVTAIYGLKQNHTTPGKSGSAAAASSATPAVLATSDELSQQQVKLSLDQFYALRNQALSGRVSRALEGGLTSSMAGVSDWTQIADAPNLWPVEGKITSAFGERQDPFVNSEGEFHAGLDISAPKGTIVRATADADVVSAGIASGYGNEIVLDHGHGLHSCYGHLSGMIVIAGQHVIRGQIIGYVGMTGRATSPHLHYEVRINNTPVNPHKYLRNTFELNEASNTPTISIPAQPAATRPTGN
jgi:murein DD-endopeptidase MepM/ murein hydrolase activator NlpD